MMNFPAISVVVPAHNEEVELPSCLQALLAQDYPHDYDIIVVDNASTDNTARAAASFGARVIHEARKGPGWARQAGFAAATGEIIASTDADSIVPPNWLSSIAEAFSKNHGAVGVGGPFALRGAPASIRASVRALFLTLPALRRLVPRSWNFSGCNFAVRASAFHQAGGFNTSLSLGEDLDLALRLRECGDVIYLPKLVVKTSGRRFSKAPVTTSVRYLSGNLKLLRAYGVLAFPSFANWQANPQVAIRFVPLLFFGVVLGFLAWASMNPGSQVFGRTYARVPTQQKIVALTFDDGPDKIYTPQILEILKGEDVPATFFVAGDKAKTYPELISQIIANGNEIGSHGYSHSRWLFLQPPAMTEKEIERTERALQVIAGVRVNLFRPPYGYKSPWLLRALTRKGYVVVEWDTSPEDWKEPGVRTIVRRVIENVKPGSIILLHDGYAGQPGKHYQTVQALPLIIGTLRQQGYQFLTVSQMLGLKNLRESG